MKVCWFGIYDAGYSRNKVLLSGLHQAKVDVVECNAIEFKGLTKYIHLIRELRSLHNDYDVIFCAFPVNYNVIIARLFQKRPIVIDAFFPLYDAYVHDRKSTQKWSLKALVYNWLDRINLRLAKLVITDTNQHKKYWETLDHSARIVALPVGAPTDEFYPINVIITYHNNFLVSFHGSYIPLQGVDKIFQAIKLLRNESTIKFRFIGPQKMFDDFHEEIRDAGDRIETISWLSTKELNKKLNEANVILGIFGDTQKTNRVVPNKVFQGIAVKKPVITKDTPAIRELFSDEEMVLTSDDPAAIAACIVDLHHNYDIGRQKAARAYEKFTKNYSETVLGLELRRQLLSL